MLNIPEKEIKDSEIAVYNKTKAYEFLDLNYGASDSEIKKAYHKKIARTHPDKWKSKNEHKKNCKDSDNCGSSNNQKNKKMFCSEVCRDVYWKCLKNYKIYENAYNLLTGQGDGNPHNGTSGHPEPCDHCKKPTYGNFYPKWKEKRDGEGNTTHYRFCSAGCCNSFSVPKVLKKCHYCPQQYEEDVGVYFANNPGMVFCSKTCARKWEKEVWDKRNLSHQKAEFIKNSLENLPGWILLSEREKQEFIKKVDDGSSPSEFSEIYRQVCQLIKTKRDEKEENEDDDDNKDNKDNDGNIYQKIKSVPLSQALSWAAGKIRNLFAENSAIKPSAFAHLWKGYPSWEAKLSSFASSEQVANFTQKLVRAVQAESNKTNSSFSPSFWEENKNWLKPVGIGGLILAAIMVLLLIFKKRHH
ncbi:MAG: hypothetical protein MRERC_5c033 [Mycoplasmataceae bacterium RC_NB112A]|nr:MAG: hypothetical protein MRERC_5c033 [Mycoplasmataceae bacterium RC_NB112A]